MRGGARRFIRSRSNLKEQGHELVGFTMQLWDQRRDQSSIGER